MVFFHTNFGFDYFGRGVTAAPFFKTKNHEAKNVYGLLRLRRLL